MTPWTVALQAPLSIEFARQEFWSGLPYPLPGDLLNPGTEPGSPTLQADFLSSELLGPPKSTMVASPLQTLNCICQDPISKSGHLPATGVGTWTHLLGAPPFHPLQLARTEVYLEGWGHLLLAPLPPSFQPKGEKKVFATHRVGGTRTPRACALA